MHIECERGSVVGLTRGAVCSLVWPSHRRRQCRGRWSWSRQEPQSHRRRRRRSPSPPAQAEPPDGSPGHSGTASDGHAKDAAAPAAYKDDKKQASASRTNGSPAHARWSSSQPHQVTVTTEPWGAGITRATQRRGHTRATASSRVRADPCNAACAFTCACVFMRARVPA
ncbi:hypothetical protein ANANG_G00012370 [Anguilla anguilla]|uniref:Uncharacterized protein n=1 Tax=Anguilla anguilla TaxID=7936 RepID=A0A9D3S6R2_ANGAN|nr:hypothetical protein ANANG_G00012370 [Anguilla anguilla]